MSPDRLDSTSISVPGKEKEMFHLDSSHSFIVIAEDLWTFIFSVKPYKQPNLSGSLYLYCHNRANRPNYSILISWDQNTFNYVITEEDGRRELVNTTINIDTSVLNHFALINGINNFILWINGVSRKTHDLTLGEIHRIHLYENNYCIVSLYNRLLTKLEIIEHYIKYHVKAFTHNEVLS